MVAAANEMEINFGGKFILIEWGCGTECQSSVIIDASTGELYRIPTSERGKEYRADSLLLVITPPSKNDEENLRPEYAYPAYYHLTEEGEFTLLFDTRELEE